MKRKLAFERLHRMRYLIRYAGNDLELEYKMVWVPSAFLTLSYLKFCCSFLKGGILSLVGLGGFIIDSPGRTKLMNMEIVPY